MIKYSQKAVKVPNFLRLSRNPLNGGGWTRIQFFGLGSKSRINVWKVDSNQLFEFVYSNLTITNLQIFQFVTSHGVYSFNGWGGGCKGLFTGKIDLNSIEAHWKYLMKIHLRTFLLNSIPYLKNYFENAFQIYADQHSQLLISICHLILMWIYWIHFQFPSKLRSAILLKSKNFIDF